MTQHRCGRFVLGGLAVIALLVVSATPGQAGGRWQGAGGYGGGYVVVKPRPYYAGPRVIVSPWPAARALHSWYGAPRYYPYYAPVYAAPVYAAPIGYPAPVAVVPAPAAPAPAAVEPEPQYWYYCQAAQSYYPYVEQCPGGWMRVVPEPAAR